MQQSISTPRQSKAQAEVQRAAMPQGSLQYKRKRRIAKYLAGRASILEETWLMLSAFRSLLCPMAPYGNGHMLPADSDLPSLHFLVRQHNGIEEHATSPFAEVHTLEKSKLPEVG